MNDFNPTNNLPKHLCACGCGQQTKSDSRGRHNKWIHGHYIVKNQKHLREERTDGKQQCTKCGGVFDLQLFGKSGNTKNGRSSWCKKCERSSSSSWRTRNRKRVNELSCWARAKKQYGLTKDAYFSMLEGQGNKCKICGAKISDKIGRRLAIDHCHNTGKVRGILCSSCNVGIGMFKNSTDLLKNAINYLTANS